MEDYERANAREWDLHDARYQANEPVEPSSDDWHVVGGSKRAGPFAQTNVPSKSKGKQKVPLQTGIGRQDAPSQRPHQQPNVPPPASKGKQRASPQKPTGRQIELLQRWNNLRAPGDNNQPRRSPPKFSEEPDNKAQLSWRNHEPPVDIIGIPQSLVIQHHINEIIPREYGTYMQNDGKRPSEGFLTFQIWGGERAVQATKKVINACIEDCSPSKKSHHPGGRFAKVASLTPELWRRAQKKWERDVKRAMFRQKPPPDKAFGAMGSFYWPVKEYRPEEVLGASCEALDSIRMDCKCYVILDDTDRSLLQILGRKEAVQEGLLRIRKTCFQIAARQIPPRRIYLLHWPEAVTFPSHVILQPYAHTRKLLDNAVLEEEQSKSPAAEGMSDDEERLEKQTVNSEQTALNACMQIIRELHYYRGNISMRIRLGRFLATQYMEPKDGQYLVEDYENMISMTQFRGRVTHE